MTRTLVSFKCFFCFYSSFWVIFLVFYWWRLEHSETEVFNWWSWVGCFTFMWLAVGWSMYGEGLGLSSLFVCRITAGPAQPCRWLLAVRGFWCGAEEVAAHGTSSEHFHRTHVRADLLRVKQDELPLCLGLCEAACAQPWAIVLPLSPLRTSSPVQPELQTVPPLEDHSSRARFWGPLRQSMPWSTNGNTHSSGDFVVFTFFFSPNLLVPSLW